MLPFEVLEEETDFLKIHLSFTVLWNVFLDAVIVIKWTASAKEDIENISGKLGHGYTLGNSYGLYIDLYL